MANYDAVVDRLTALQPDIHLRILDHIAGFPVYSATINPSATASFLWVNAGTHGDEPAGVEAALRFLECWCPDRLIETKVLVTPCLNPFGYRNDLRENHDGIDVNWAFKRDDVAEIKTIKRLIDGVKLNAIIDLHEDWESPGYYLYEQIRNRSSLGRTITERVRTFCPVNDESTIEGEIASLGVIYPSMDVPKRKSGEGVPVEVFNRATDHQITSESPSCRPVAERVKAHLTAIDVLLCEYGQ